MIFGSVPPFDGVIKGKRIIWETEGEVVWIEPYGKNAIRFRSCASLRIDETLNWTLLEPTVSDEAEIEVTDEKAVLRNGKILVEILGDGTVNYYKDNDNMIISESWPDAREGTAPQRRAREYRAISSDAFKTSLYFKPVVGEHFYGLGQEPNDCFNLKGSTIELLHKNTKSTIPYIVSSKGYGFIWNNPAIGRVEFGNNHTHWHAQACKQMDYIVIAGDNPSEITERLTDITGRSPMIPEWALGFWQCKLRYKTQQELLEVAREHKRRNIPLSVIVADYFHWTQQGEWKFNPKFWPDPKAMVDELNEMGVKLMVSVWPTVDVRSENYDYMRNKNYTLKAEKGINHFFMFLGPQTYYDATHPGARKFLWSKVKENYYDAGIRMFWLDEAEPELRPYDYDNVRYYLGNGLEVSNLYPYYYAKTFYEGMKSENENEVVNLIRCAWLGVQKYGTVVWSGDIASTFDSLRKQMKAGLNISMCGIPWWTTDIGGFLFGDPDAEDFRELLIRWFQYGVFCPIFRMHGYRLPYEQIDDNNFNGEDCTTGGPNEVWSFGEQAYEIITELIQLRERMKPYIMKHMKKATQDGTPVMRPLLFDFYEDERVLDISDEFMFGSDLLVAPIIEQGKRKREVYLPKGARWTDAKTRQTYEGGTTISVDAPIHAIPLFFRDGVELPIYID